MGAHIHTETRGSGKTQGEEEANYRRRETRRSRTTEGELSHTLGLRTVLSSPIPRLLAHRFFFLFLLLLLHHHLRLFILFLCRTLDQDTQPAPKVAISSSLSLFSSDTRHTVAHTVFPPPTPLVSRLSFCLHPPTRLPVRLFVRSFARSLACLPVFAYLPFF